MSGRSAVGAVPLRPAEGTAGPAAKLRPAVGAEWIKLRSIRSTRWTLVGLAVVVPALAVFVGATGSLQPDDTVLGGSLTGAVLGQLAAAILGALVVTTEHGTTLRTTFTACPRRTTVLVAKAVTVAAVVFPVSLVACTGAYLLGDRLLDDGHRSGEPMPALLGIAACLTASALLGLAVGAVVRQSAGAVTAVVGIVLLPSMLGPLFGDLQRWVAGAAPSATLQKLTQTSDATPEAVGSLGAWPSLAAFTVATLAALVVAARLVEHRDA